MGVKYTVQVCRNLPTGFHWVFEKLKSGRFLVRGHRILEPSRHVSAHTPGIHTMGLHNEVTAVI